MITMNPTFKLYKSLVIVTTSDPYFIKISDLLLELFSAVV